MSSASNSSLQSTITCTDLFGGGTVPLPIYSSSAPNIFSHPNRIFVEKRLSTSLSPITMVDIAAVGCSSMPTRANKLREEIKNSQESQSLPIISIPTPKIPDSTIGTASDVDSIKEYIKQSNFENKENTLEPHGPPYVTEEDYNEDSKYPTINDEYAGLTALSSPSLKSESVHSCAPLSEQESPTLRHQNDDSSSCGCNVFLHQGSIDAQVANLSDQLTRAQNQLASLLEEKQRWLISTHSPEPKRHSISTDKAELVVKYCQSEQLRLKAENRVKELESEIQMASQSASSTSVDSANISPPTKLQFEELNKTLTAVREKNENMRYSLQQEEKRVRELNSNLNAAREAHRAEQKRAASYLETIQRLNRENEANKRFLKELDRLREREAERLCSEVTVRDTMEKFNRVNVENTRLLERVEELKEFEKRYSELLVKFDHVETRSKDYLSLKQDLEACQIRESQLSEFTKRLAERNAGLQADYLTLTSRLETSDLAAVEANRTNEDNVKLTRETEAKLEHERRTSEKMIEDLKQKLKSETELRLSLQTELETERDERAALRRKQHALDRELARLLSHSSQPIRNGVQQSSTNSISDSVATSFDEIANIEPNSNVKTFLANQSESLSKFEIGDALMTSLDTEVIFNSAETVLVPSQLYSSERSPDLSFDDAQILTVEPTKSSLLKKIDRLQRLNVRLMEKADFLRDHVEQLTEELQRKSFLLQKYFISDAASVDSAAPVCLDENKQNMIHKGGLMASVFAGQIFDGQANLKCSLQINQKMQRVLEDALCQNITLKENVDTLADEVGRLSRANRELKELLSSGNLS